MIVDDAGFYVRLPSEFEGVSRRDVLDVGAYVGALGKGCDRGVLPRTSVGRCRDLLTPTQGQSSSDSLAREATCPEILLRLHFAVDA